MPSSAVRNSSRDYQLSFRPNANSSSIYISVKACNDCDCSGWRGYWYDVIGSSSPPPPSPEPVTISGSNPVSITPSTSSSGSGPRPSPPPSEDYRTTYPNPASSTLTIEEQIDLEGYEHSARYELYNFQGEIVSQGTIETLTTIDLSSFERGRYILRIYVDDRVENHNIIVN